MPGFSRRTFLKVLGVSTTAATASELRPGGLLLRALTDEEKTALQAPQEQWLPTVCGQCPAGCGIMVRVVEGRAIKIDGLPAHPSNRGKTCPKGQNGLQVLYDPDRIQGPMRRVGERGAGDWQAVSWEEAIAEVAGRLSELRASGEPHTAVVLAGRVQGQMEGLLRRFCQAYGTPNYVDHDSISMATTKLAHQYAVGHHALFGYDWENTNFLLSFGVAFLEAYQPTVRNLLSHGIMRRGRPHQRARIVQVDTRFSVTASKADEWVPIIPGTDGALALGMAYVIISEDLYDHDFVTNHTFGFEDWTDDAGVTHLGWKTLVLRDYAPGQVEGLTGVPSSTIARLAREFASTPPAVAIANRSTSMQSNGLFNQMAVEALNALVGSFGRAGGPMIQRAAPYLPWPEVRLDSIAQQGLGQPRIDHAGGDRYPLAKTVYQQLPESIANDDPYPVNALFLYYTNPLFSSPEVEPVREALKKVPFVVTFSPFLDESSQYADLILPDHVFLERLQDVEMVPSTGYPVVGLRQPVIAPLFDTRHSGDVLLEVARKLGGTVALAFPWQGFEELLQYRVNGLWRSEQGDIIATEYQYFWEEFRLRSLWSDPPYRFGEWRRVFNTPSGRYEFHAQGLKADLDEAAGGEDRIDDLLARMDVQARGDEAFLPHHEAPRFVGEPAEYPFFLNTYKLMTHAEGRGANQPHLQEILGTFLNQTWDSWVEINPRVANHLGISDGDQVWIESPLGERLQVRAVLFEGARPDVVNIPFELGHEAYGRWARGRGVNPNRLVVNDTNPLTGSLNPYATRVKVYRA
ncbi:MAG: molybdopterin-dependent oxidoreductase [Anaerolineae bacterium]|nr:molybdopterin-dependent oxidoreductase [Anaerolineae bacterium]